MLEPVTVNQPEALYFDRRKNEENVHGYSLKHAASSSFPERVAQENDFGRFGLTLVRFTRHPAVEAELQQVQLQEVQLQEVQLQEVQEVELQEEEVQQTPEEEVQQTPEEVVQYQMRSLPPPPLPRPPQLRKKKDRLRSNEQSSYFHQCSSTTLMYPERPHVIPSRTSLKVETHLHETHCQRMLNRCSRKVTEKSKPHGS